jgi:hypothetical protein
MAAKWDLFLAHASEDKPRVAVRLARELERFGLSVWFDEFELRVGDNLVSKIDEGLAAAERGVVILSPHFFAKKWTNREYQGLIAKEMSGGPAVIPVWHEVGYEDVVKASPSLAAVFAADTSNFSIPSIAFQIAESVRPDLTKALMAGDSRPSGGPTHVIPLKRLQVGPMRHSSLSPALAIRAQIIHEVFEGTLTREPQDTMDDFCREEDPELEVELWESMVLVFLQLKPWSRDGSYRQALANALLSASLGDRTGAKQALEVFPDHEADEVIMKIDRTIDGAPLEVSWFKHSAE